MLSNSSSIPGAAGTSSLTSSIALQACRRPWRPGTRKRWNCSRGRRTAPPWRRGSTTTTRGAGRTRKRRTRCNGRRPPPWRCARPASPARGGSGGPCARARASRGKGERKTDRRELVVAQSSSVVLLGYSEGVRCRPRPPRPNDSSRAQRLTHPSVPSFSTPPPPFTFPFACNDERPRLPPPPPNRPWWDPS